VTARRDVVSVNLSNPQHSASRSEQRARLRRIKRAHRPAVIATQEALPGLRLWGYRKYQGPGGLCELAVFVRKGITVTDHGAKKSVDGVSGRWPDRGLVWVRLGDGLAVVNVHPNSHIDLGGRPLPGVAWRVTRDEHFPDVDDTIEILKASGARVTVLGDWNIDRRADRRHKDPAFPFARMRALKMAEVIYKGSSLGGRAVDRAFYDPTRLRPAKAKLLGEEAGFDHRALWLRLRYVA